MAVFSHVRFAFLPISAPLLLFGFLLRVHMFLLSLSVIMFSLMNSDTSPVITIGGFGWLIPCLSARVPTPVHVNLWISRVFVEISKRKLPVSIFDVRGGQWI